jgi:hypothetical protein
VSIGTSPTGANRGGCQAREDVLGSGERHGGGDDPWIVDLLMVKQHIKTVDATAIFCGVDVANES